MHFCWNNKIYQSARSKNSLICRIKVIGAVTFEGLWQRTVFKNNRLWEKLCLEILQHTEVFTCSSQKSVSSLYRWADYYDLPLWTGLNPLIFLQLTQYTLHVSVCCWRLFALPTTYLPVEKLTQHMCWWVLPNLLIHVWLRDYRACMGPNQQLIKCWLYSLNI